MPDNDFFKNTLLCKIDALLEAQQIGNYLAMSTNPKIFVEIQEQALDKALTMQGLFRQQRDVAQQFIDNDLPSDLVR